MRVALVIAVAASWLSGAGIAFAVEPPEDYRTWCKMRENTLRLSTGYLSLTGLYWLKEGRQSLGSSPDCDLVIPGGRGPAQAAVINVDHGRVTVVSRPDVEITVDGKRITSSPMISDRDGQRPKEFKVEDMTFWLIDRYGRQGIRLSDPQSPMLKAYDGTHRFDWNDRWIVPATVERGGSGETVRVPSVIGESSEEPVAATIRFSWEGKTHALRATSLSNRSAFVVFGDQSNGKSTYEGGRFIRVDVPAEGAATVIDFNRAYNPPCAYNPNTTCPMPPAGNVLPFAVEAGETTRGIKRGASSLQHP